MSLTNLEVIEGVERIYINYNENTIHEIIPVGICTNGIPVGICAALSLSKYPKASKDLAYRFMDILKLYIEDTNQKMFYNHEEALTSDNSQFVWPPYDKEVRLKWFKEMKDKYSKI